MMVLNGQSNQIWHYFAGKHPGKVGMLLGPSYFAKQAIRFWMPYALDNDAFQCFTKKKEWNEAAWIEMLKLAKLTRQRPLFCIVPDVVCDREKTLESWEKYSPVVIRYGWPLAFAVQNGMDERDVPKNADIVFIGGDTEWKWSTLPEWCRLFKRVHVGRVNEIRRLWTCEDYGVESVDGSGWFRGTDGGRQARQLIQWIEGQRSEIYDHKELNLEPQPLTNGAANR